MDAFDVAIAGGGIIGTTIAFELANAGLRVVVLDRQEPGREASWAAAGMLSPGPDSSAALPLVPFARESFRRYPELISKLEEVSGQRVPYARNGTLELFAGPNSEAARDAMIAQYHELGLTIESAALQAIRKREPSIGPHITAAAWLPEEATVEPRALVSAVIAACKSRGVEFRSSRAVTSYLRDGDSCVGIVAGDAKIRSRNVVIAAGAFCSQTQEGDEGNGRDISRRFSPTHPVRGQMIALRHPQIQLTRVLRSEKAYLVPRLDGRLIAGSTLENVGFDKQVTSGGIHKILEGVREMVPALVDADIVETWAGLRPGTPDELPIIGKTSVDGLLVATGHYRNGVLLAPATAAAISDLIVKGNTAMKIEAFSPLRFASPSSTSEKPHSASAAD
jgi:glycine oxidase